MRSLMRVSVLMGGLLRCLLVHDRRETTGQQGGHHTIGISALANRKALHIAGPDADRSRLTPPAQNAVQASADACDRTAGPLRSAVGAGLHLLSLAFAGTVDRDSLSGMTDDQIPPSSDASAEPSVRELAEIPPAVEVITRSAVMLMSAAAEKLGLADPDPDDSPHRDLDEARRLITALAGLVTASAEYLGLHAGPLRDGLKSLQLAFREASVDPEEPGKGPGEKYTGPVW